jgi:hypothetical protein
MRLEDLQADLAEYKRSMTALNNELDRLEKRKRELIEFGMRIEGAIVYINKRLGDATKVKPEEIILRGAEQYKESWGK